MSRNHKLQIYDMTSQYRAVDPFCPNSHKHKNEKYFMAPLWSSYWVIFGSLSSHSLYLILFFEQIDPHISTLLIMTLSLTFLLFHVVFISNYSKYACASLAVSLNAWRESQSAFRIIYWHVIYDRFRLNFFWKLDVNCEGHFFDFFFGFVGG